MSVVTVSDRLVRVLETFAPGENLEAKLEHVTRDCLESQLGKCNEAVRSFETRYGIQRAGNEGPGFLLPQE